MEATNTSVVALVIFATCPCQSMPLPLAVFCISALAATFISPNSHGVLIAMFAMREGKVSPVHPGFVTT